MMKFKMTISFVIFASWLSCCQALAPLSSASNDSKQAVPRAIIKIQGSEGSAKEVIVQKAAEKLGHGFRHLDTGSVYRAFAYFFVRQGSGLYDFKNPQSVLSGLKAIKDITLEPNSNHSFSVILTGPYGGRQNITSELVNSRDLDEAVATLAQYDEVKDKANIIFRIVARISASETLLVSGTNVQIPGFENAISIHLNVPRAERAALQTQRSIDAGLKVEHHQVHLALMGRPSIPPPAGSLAAEASVLSPLDIERSAQSLALSIRERLSAFQKPEDQSA